jgi:hypothetical protein
MRTLVNSIVRKWTGKTLPPGGLPDRLHELVALVQRTVPTLVVIVLNLFR